MMSSIRREPRTVTNGMGPIPSQPRPAMSKEPFLYQYEHQYEHQHQYQYRAL